MYIAAEGVNGYHSRIEAWKAKHNWSGRVGVHFVATAVQLGDHRDVDRVIEIIQKAGMKPKLVVVDTLHRCLGGDENSACDVRVAIDAMDRIRKATGATVAFVHHTTKSDGSFRGSSALKGAVDLMIHTTINQDHVTATCEKMKDGEPFKPLAFDLPRFAGSRVLNLVGSGERTEGDTLTGNDGKACDALAAMNVGQLGSVPDQAGELGCGCPAIQLLPTGFCQRPSRRAVAS